MKIQEINVVFNCLDGTTELSRSDTLGDIQTPDQPHTIQLVRILFEGGYMYQRDEQFTVVQRGNFKVTFANDESDTLVIHGDSKNPEPAGYEGTIEELLHQYKAPIDSDDLSRMKMVYTRIMVTLKPIN